MKKVYSFLVLFFLVINSNGQNSFVLTDNLGNKDTLKIYINPGHGGYDADDRNVAIYPFGSADTLGFYESKSNLRKGLYIRSLIQERQGKVIMSRTLNRSIDDRPLSTLGEEANANNCDFMISIHSNAATGSVNFPLTIYKGKDAEPKIAGSDSAAIIHWQQLKKNELTNWTYNHAPHNARGDWSFYGSEDYLGVLRGSNIPTFLSEDSFHDYIPETYRWMSDVYSKLHAWFYLKTFSLYFKTGSETKGIVTGSVKDEKRSFQSAFLPFIVTYVAIGKDAYKPLNGTKVTLMGDGGFEKVFIVDNMYNGIFLFDNVIPGNYTLKYELDKYETKTTAIVVKADEITYDLCFLNLDRTNPLQVLRHAPVVSNISTDSVSTRSKIRLYFNFELDRNSFESAFSISPSVAGTFQYSNLDRDVTFIPVDPFQAATVYTVKIEKSAKHIGAVSMIDDYQFSFITKKKRFLQLIDTYPKQGMEDVHPNTQIRIIFDNPILSDGANVKMVLSDLENNTIQAEGILINDYTNGLGSYFFRPKNLISGTQYKLTIKPDVFNEDSLILNAGTTIQFKVSDKIDVASEAVFDKFELLNKWKIDRTASSNIAETGNVMARYSTIAYAGSYSYRLLYKFTSYADAKIVTKILTPTTTVTKGKFLGMYVFGDISYNNFSLIVAAGTDTLRLPVCKLDFAGWKLKEIGFDNLPEGNSYQILGLQIDGVGGLPQSTEGSVLVDNFALYDNSLTVLPDVKSISAFQLYPNPASDYVSYQLFGNEPDSNYNLTSVDGRLIKQGKEDLNYNIATVNINDIAKGIYIFQVTFNGKEPKRCVLIVNK